MSRMGSLRDRLNRSVSPVKSPSQLFDSGSDIGDVNVSSLVEELKAARTLNRSVSYFISCFECFWNNCTLE